MVKGKPTSLSFIEMVDIKKYYNNFVFLSICNFFIIGDLNYVGLMIPTAKLDTCICRRSMEFGFIWFAKDEKFPEDIIKIFHSMVVDMIALILSPT